MKDFSALFPPEKQDLFDQLVAYGVDVGIGKIIIPSVLFNGVLQLFMIRWCQNVDR